MAKKLSAEYIIQARDKYSKEFKKAGKSGVNLGKVLRRAIGLAAVYFGGRAIKRQLQESVELYGIQEKAVKSLSDALGLLGKNTPEVMADMKKFASSIQAVTKYGDEAVLELMAMGSTMGNLAGKELKEGTKAAIGLATAYKMEVAAAMRLVARAAVGDTAQLKRYGIMIEATLSPQDKLNRLIEIGAEKFKLAEGEVNTYQGAMQQMKNAVGDVKEKIGAALIPMLISSAQRMKAWAENNQDRIGRWAEKTVSAVTKVKESFMAFVKYAKNDWQAGITFAMDTILSVAKATMKSLIDIMVEGARSIWLAFSGEMAVRRRAIEMFKELHGREPETGVTGIIKEREMPEIRRLRGLAREESKANLMADFVERTSAKITQNYRDMALEIKKNTPEFLQKKPVGYGDVPQISGRSGGGLYGPNVTAQLAKLYPVLETIAANTAPSNQPKPIVINRPGRM